MPAAHTVRVHRRHSYEAHGDHQDRLAEAPGLTGNLLTRRGGPALWRGGPFFMMDCEAVSPETDTYSNLHSMQISESAKRQNTEVLRRSSERMVSTKIV